MRAHISVDMDSGLVHSLMGTMANVADVTRAHELLHGEETAVFGDAGYQGAHKRSEPDPAHTVEQVAIRPGKQRQLDPTQPLDQLKDWVEKLKASIQAKVEHSFQVVKQDFGYRKVRYRGLAKNTAQLYTLFALANLVRVRRQLLALDGRGASGISDAMLETQEITLESGATGRNHRRNGTQLHGRVQHDLRSLQTH